VKRRKSTLFESSLKCPSFVKTHDSRSILGSLAGGQVQLRAAATTPCKSLRAFAGIFWAFWLSVLYWWHESQVMIFVPENSDSFLKSQEHIAGMRQVMLLQHCCEDILRCLQVWVEESHMLMPTTSDVLIRHEAAACCDDDHASPCIPKNTSLFAHHNAADGRNIL